MMRDAILNFAKQFKYRPKVEGGKVKKYKKFVVAGMGGSHLSAGILKSLKPELDVTIWRDYGLPVDLSHHPGPPQAGHPSSTFVKTSADRSGRRGKILVIASSYSGNTEETISAFEAAVKNNLPVVAITTGGKLLELARQYQVPYIQLPASVEEPRMALGFSLMALLKLTKEKELFKETTALAKILKPQDLEAQGKALAEKLKGKVPVIYSSERNLSVAYNWKIKFNETGKIPAFYNVFPELNHNEINGFDIKEATKALGLWAYFIFLKDSEDHPRVIRRLEVTEQLYRERGLPTVVLELFGTSRLEKIFNSLLLADWTAVHTALNYGLRPEGQPMVDEFKKLIAS